MGKRGPAPGDTHLKRLVRDEEIVTLDLKGYRDYEIAKQMKVSVSTVEKVLAKARRAAVERMTQETIAHVVRKIEELRVMRREYWAAWERSQSERQITETEKSEGDGEGKGRGSGVTKKAKIRREGRDGTPSWLDGVQWCFEQEAKLLDLYPAARQEISGLEGGPIQTTSTVIKVPGKLDQATWSAMPKPIAPADDVNDEDDDD
jgi:predicted transcriptional regulator